MQHKPALGDVRFPMAATRTKGEREVRGGDSNQLRRRHSYELSSQGEEGERLTGVFSQSVHYSPACKTKRRAERQSGKEGEATNERASPGMGGFERKAGTDAWHVESRAC
jgi:hypothetical protein